jgi:hypothetical protein
MNWAGILLEKLELFDTSLHISSLPPQATVVSLPTIESSYVNHTTKGIQGFDHPEFPALRVTLEVLNAAESYLWVRYIFCEVYLVLTVFPIAISPRGWSCLRCLCKR